MALASRPLLSKRGGRDCHKKSEPLVLRNYYFWEADKMARGRNLLTVASMGVALFVSAATAYADRRGDALLNRCVHTMSHLKTVRCDFTLKIFFSNGASDVRHKGVFLLQREPRRVLSKARYSVDGKPMEYVILEKGDLQTIYSPENNRSNTFRKPDWAWRGDWGFGNIWGVIFDKEMLLQYAPKGVKRTIAGTYRVGDVVCQTLVVENNPSYSVMRLYIAPDGTLRGMDRKGSSEDGQTISTVSRITNVKTDIALPESVFDWTPPTGAMK